MVLPPKFEFLPSPATSLARDESLQRAEVERSMQATRLLSDQDRTDSRRGESGDAIYITRDHQEFFVSSPPAMALAQQFQRERPEFIAVHDIGCQWSRRLLTGVAAASGRSLAQFDIRQEGSGAILARLLYVECPTNDGTSLRLYTTDLLSPAASESAGTDSSREQIALALLAYARLGVAIVGDMSITAMRAAMAPLNQSMQQGPWPSRQLLLLPLTSAGALASLGSEFSEDTGVTVRSTPQVAKTGDAWAFVSGTWNRLRDELMQREIGYGGQSITLPMLPGARRPGAPSSGASMPRPATASALPTRPVAAVPSPVTTHEASGSAPASHVERVLDDARVKDLVQRVGRLQGLIACTVFGRSATSGEATKESPYVAPPSLDKRPAPSRDVLVAEGLALSAQLERSSQALGNEAALCDAMISTPRGHVLLRPVPRRADLLLIAVFEQTDQPMLHDLQLRRIEADVQGRA